MGFDKTVHSKPEFYSKKLDLISASKHFIYKLLLIDRHITQQREEIARLNRAMIDKYLTGKKVLVVGCGRGSFLASLVEKNGCICHGVDISPEMIAFARENNPGPDYRVIDSAQLPFGDSEFDFVIFTYVLHHVDDLERTIAEAKRVGRHVIIYECCAFEHQPLKAFSNLYWKAVDGGMWYKSIPEWKKLFGLPVVEEIRGSGLIRYGMCLFRK
jgi:ubiquinone/menaquinone biosynthesis C-methylase UbiE